MLKLFSLFILQNKHIKIGECLSAAQLVTPAPGFQEMR